MAAPFRALFLAGYAAYFVAAVVLAAVNHVPESFLLSLTLAGFLVVRAAPLAFQRRELGWFHPLVFSAVIALPNLLREFPVYETGMLYHRGLPGRSPWELDRLFAWELALTTLGLGFYYLGYFFGRVPRPPRWRFPAVRHLAAKAVVTAGVAGVVLAAFVARRGGLTAHVLSWARGRSFGLAGEGYWVFLAGLGSTAALLWFALDRKAMRSPLFWATVLGVSACSFLAAGSRSSVLYPVIIAFFVWMMRERRLPVLRGVLLAVGGLALLAALGAIRHSGHTGKVAWNVVTGPDAATPGVGGALDELSDRSLARRGTTAILGRVPNEVNYIYGSSYLALVTLPIPRKLWPGKPGLVGGRTGDTFFGIHGGMPPGTIGEAWWNFGFLGVPLVFFAFGMFHRWLARLGEAYPREPVVMCLYVTVLFVAQPSSGGVVTTLLRAVPIVAMALAFGALRPQRAG